MQNPILQPSKKTHAQGDFSTEELSLANRNNGTLLETLRYDVTPVGAHYLLNHFDVPFVQTAGDWQITLQGTVRHPQTIRLAEVIELAEKRSLTRELRVTLECAGNGRANVTPRWPSQPWQVEAVGTSDWYGVPLKHVLELSDPTDASKEVVFHGADQGIDGGEVHHFARSLTISDALNNDVMLVWQMNGQMLLPQHGFPLRLIVPGWYGMASVKWLNRIEVIDQAFTGHQQIGTYVYRRDDNDPGAPVTSIRVKSLMVPPGIPDWSSRKRLLQPGTVELTGRAWSGSGVPISKVEWTSGQEWQEATIKRSDHKYGWCQWNAVWQATQGQHFLSCRATDADGNVQPLDPPWDKAGFGNNAVQQIEVWCDDF